MGVKPILLLRNVVAVGASPDNKKPHAGLQIYQESGSGGLLNAVLTVPQRVSLSQHHPASAGREL